MWSTWRIHKYLIFIPGSSQNGRFSGRNGRVGAVLSKREPPAQNGRVGTYRSINVNIIKCYIIIYNLLQRLGKRRLNFNIWLVQFVIFKPLSYCFKETIGFDVKALFTTRPVLRLIRWYNKPGDTTKEFWEKGIQFRGTFHGLKITNSHSVTSFSTIDTCLCKFEVSHNSGWCNDLEVWC